MAGISQTQDVVRFAAKLGNAAGRILQDDKFTWTEIVEVIPALLELPNAISGISEVPGEFADLDEAEKNQLAEFLANEFDIPQDQLEMAVEDHVKVVLAIWLVVKKYYLKPGQVV